MVFAVDNWNLYFVVVISGICPNFRFVLWSSEDDVVCVFIPDIFALIRKKALSNNVGTSYDTLPLAYHTSHTIDECITSYLIILQ